MNESLPRLLLVAQLAATLFLTGVIWFVQVVHYPLFASTGGAEFRAFERRHRALTTWVVAPSMLAEGVCAMLLFWLRPSHLTVWQLVPGLLLLIAIWASTAFVQIPCHERLSHGFDVAAHRRLVRTNWVRTAAWSARGVLAVWLVWLAPN